MATQQKAPEPCPEPEGESTKDCVGHLHEELAKAKASKADAERDRAKADAEIKQADESIKRLEALPAKLREQEPSYRCARMKLRSRCECLAQFWIHANEELDKQPCLDVVERKIREAKNERQRARCTFLALSCSLEGSGPKTAERERDAAAAARAWAQAYYYELVELGFDERLATLEELKAEIERAACDEDVGRWWYLLREVFGPLLAALHAKPGPYRERVIYPDQGAAGCMGETGLNTDDDYDLVDYGDPSWVCACACRHGGGKSGGCAVVGRCKQELPPTVPWCDLEPDEYCQAVRDALAALAEANAELAAARAAHESQQERYEQDLLDALSPHSEPRLATTDPAEPPGTAPARRAEPPGTAPARRAEPPGTAPARRAEPTRTQPVTTRRTP
jgi:hypothetical protein